MPCWDHGIKRYSGMRNKSYGFNTASLCLYSIQAGRCENGKGNYWSVHPANMDDFRRGDFRRRRARIQVSSLFNYTCADILTQSALTLSSTDLICIVFNNYMKVE